MKNKTQNIMDIFGQNMRVTNTKHLTRLFSMLPQWLFIFCASTVLFAALAQAQYTPDWRLINGSVLARAVVLDPDTGQPILVEFNEDGSEAGEVNIPAPFDENINQLSVISASEYLSYRQQLADYNSQHADGLAKGAELMSRQQYQEAEFLAANNVTVINQPDLPRGVNSVLVRGQSNRILLTPNDLVLLSFPVDLTQDVNVTENDTSVVVSKEGHVIAQSSYNIAFRTGFYGDPSEPQGIFPAGVHIDVDDTRFAPVPFVKVYAPSYVARGAVGVTDNTGRYVIRFLLPICPIRGYNFLIGLEANLYYKNFYPMGSPTIPYVLRRQDEQYCDAGLILPGPTYHNTVPQSFPVYQNNFYVDVLFVTGRIGLINNYGEEVTIGDTTYSAFEEAAEDRSQRFYDFNGDGLADTVIKGKIKTITNDDDVEVEAFVRESQLDDGEDPDLQGIFFDGQQNTPEESPDIVRVIDQTPRFQSVGLLKTISEDDLQNTDILFFRESTGQLIMERRGLKEAESKGLPATVVDTDNTEVAYRVMLRGPRDDDLSFGGGFRGNGFEQWATDNMLTEPFQKREADHLKPGETVKIVAINRATGYTGTARARLTSAGQNGTGLLSVEVPPITLRPPNLKIWAERNYEVEQGLTAGEERTYKVGAEGAALTSDTTVTIYTEWLDYYGRPLPTELGLDNGEQYGFTGRLAKVVAEGVLQATSAGSDLAEFPIGPGRNTQVVNVGSNLTTAEHFYIHVIGKAKDQECVSSSSCPSFTTLGASGSEPYDTRPALLTPFLVPLFDEDRYWIEYNTYRQLDKAYDPTNPDAVEPTKQLPAYTWVYRPEYQFSQYQLEMDEINRVENVGETDETATNILKAKTPTIGSSDDAITALYSLIGANFERLTPIDGKQELILALGEEEQLVTIDKNQTITFENVEHLSLLDPEDFLTMRLYTNNDAGNVLWEYGFEYIYIEPTIIGYENQTDDVFYVTADNPVVELKSTIAGYAYRDSTKAPAKVSWKANGDGSFAQNVQTSKDLGIFDNTLTMSTAKGATANLSVELKGGSGPARWKTVEVLAGEPHHIAITESGQAVSLAQGDVRLDIIVYDQFNNRVEDGTAVEFGVDDSFIIKEQSLETENGQAHIVLTGGEYTVPNSVVTVESGVASAQQNLSIEGLTVLLTADTVTLAKQQVVTVTATVTTPDGSPVSDIPVGFSAGKGLFAEQEILTDVSGVAQNQFTGGLNEQADTWVAQTGYVGIAELDYSIQNAAPDNIDAQDAMLVADESVAGSITFTEFDVTSTIAYETEGTIDVRAATAGTVIIGDLADPNLEPLVSLSMNDLSDTGHGPEFQDEHLLNPARADEITIVYDHPLGAGRSAHFTAASRVSFSNNAQFNLNQNVGFRLDVKPIGNGTIVEHAAGTQRLSYIGGSLSYSVITDAGTFSVQAPNVTASVWHRVATRMANNTLELYVDGQLYSQAITGELVYSGNTAIKLGGLEAVMRGFRLYDWSSSPLITFADGSTEQATVVGNQSLTLRSLGNLGNLQTGSQLNSLRVAVITNDQRNYVSLLTKRGYQEIVQQYLITVSPQSPYALYTVPNPLSSFVPSAHAQILDGVWDGAKSAIGFLIPYEDFITIGEQLVYLMNQDWENFDATKLAFASLGAATVIPIAKPLKPLLAPLKKVVDGMKRFPGAKHFAGAIGTAVKAGLGGKTEKLANLLPFILITVELYEDPEVFEFIMESIESEDDLWVWVDVIADTVTLEGGIDELAATYPPSTGAQVVVNPLSWIVDTAHAQGFSRRQRVGKAMIARVKKYSKYFPASRAKQVTEAWKVLKRPELAAVRNLALKSGTVVRYLAIVGGAKVAQFARNSRNWRVNRWFVLFAISYLGEELAADRLEVGDERKLFSLIAAVFSNKKNESNGALFQLSQVTYFHAISQLVDGAPKVLGIEQERPAYYLINGVRAPGEAYKRRVDIIIEAADGGEEWVETKSLSKSTFSKSKFKNVLSDKQSYYRQFFHDLRLNDSFIIDDIEAQRVLIPDSEGMKSNAQYSWYFQKWKGNLTKGIPPTASEEGKAQDWLCLKPNIRHIKSYYKANMAESAAATKSLCREKRKARIQLRDTESYLSSIVSRLIKEKGLEIEDYLNVVNGITDPNWL